MLGIVTERAETQGCQEVDESEGSWAFRLLLVKGTFISRSYLGTCY